MGWFRKIRANIKKGIKQVKPEVRKITLSTLALFLVFSLIFGLNIVRGPVPTAGQSFLSYLDD